MGIDVLDITLRLEQRYGIQVTPSDWESALQRRDPSDVTAREIHQIVMTKLSEAGKPVPRSCWNGVRLALSESLGKSPSKIRPASRLIKDLGMT